MVIDFMQLISHSYEEMLALISKREKTANDRILTKIYQNGPAPEHWYKFELFAQLCRFAAVSGLRACIERQYSKNPKRQADLAIEQNQELAAIIELKVISNWYLKGNLKAINSDIEKMSRIASDIRKYLLVIVQYAQPKNGRVEWMKNQILSEQTEDVNKFRQRINNHIDDSPFLLKSVVKLGFLKLDNELFESYELGGMIFEI